ncbi:MAG: CHAP domain-containing protein [Oscillospiraceae bacterium]|nr:CHAP domain-containing protein [Oscillospiraceae bacterium]
MGASKDPLRIAVEELGVTEKPANSNSVKYNTWFYGRAVSGSAYPWCMAFVQWCFDQAGRTLPCKTASCSALLNWYRQNQPECVVKTPQPGDIVIYNFGHTGIAESAAASTITAIEGNTSAGNSGSQSNGGGVFRRVRSKTLVTAYIRPLQINTEEKDIMTGKEIYDALQSYLAQQLVPDWAKTELQEAVDLGITDGSNPMQLIPRYQTAIMTKRAVKR